LKGESSKMFLGGALQFIYAENIGGMLGMGSRMSSELRFILFRIFVSTLLIVMFFYLVLKQDLGKRHSLALVLILSGGIGNLLNRFADDGKVIDFIVLELFGMHTGIFNIADIYVTVGISYLIISNIMKRHTRSTITS
jgi:signal peptidase II